MLSLCLPWKTLLALSLAVLHADFTESGAFAGLSECKSATIDDVNESLKKYSECLPEMIAKGEEASINSLAWTLQETLDQLRPVQEQCEAPPEPRLPLLAVEQRGSGEAQRKLFVLQKEPSVCIYLEEEEHNINDPTAAESTGAGEAQQHKQGGPAVPAALSSSTATGPALPSSQSPCAVLELACQSYFSKKYLDSFGHNSTECQCCECKYHREPPLKFCKQLPPCPRPVAPKNGGLVCVTIDSTQYCKPMCNKGYDFQFLRSSRLYEVCGNATGFAWTTQLVGGKALAVCNPSEMAISGAKSAYFPSNSSCVHTLAFPETQAEQLNIFLQEMAQQGIDGSSRDQGADCVICGH